MNFKSLTILLAIFLIQCITSCIGGMGPGCDTDQYAVYYRSVEVNPFTSLGAIDTEKETEIDPADFGLNISVLFEMEDFNVAHNIRTKAGFGFTPALARDCVLARYLFEDPIDHIEILVNEASLVVTPRVITDAFSVERSFNTDNYYNDDIEELYKDTELWHNDFIFTLTDPQAVPQTARFTIEVYKQSGIKFTAQTPVMTFQK